MLLKYFGIFLRGMAMGAADVVPGVSGGTIAFITGIYDQLLSSIHNADHVAVKLLLQFKFRELAARLNLKFLLPLLLGIALSILSLAKIITRLLERYPEALWAFFFGLVLASSLLIIKTVQQWRPLTIFSLMAGSLVAYFIVSMNVLKTPDTLPFIFLSGVIAIIAMILPGISGSYILLILDKYRYIIGIVSGIPDGLNAMLGNAGIVKGFIQAQFHELAVFAMGCVLGLISFAKLLRWLLLHYHDITMASLTGFMIGSLYKVWPWKIVLEYYTDRHGKILPLKEANVFPEVFDVYFFVCLWLIIAGFGLVYMIDIIAKKIVPE
jgi:putative membrane protein